MYRMKTALLIAAALMAAPILPASAGGFDSAVAHQSWRLLSQIEQREDIPLGLLHAMSLVETGQRLDGKMLPWPYTVGVNSPGMTTFDTTDAALAELKRLRAMGFKRFDILIGDDKRYSLSEPAVTDAFAKHYGTTYGIKARHFAKRFRTAHEAARFARGFLIKGYDNLDLGLMQINWKWHKDGFANLDEVFDPHRNATYAVDYLSRHRTTRDWWGSVGRYHSGTQHHAKRYIRSVWAMYRRVHRLSGHA